MPSAFEFLRPDRRHRFQRGLGRAVGQHAQHGAEARRVVDDAAEAALRMCGSAACATSIGARTLMAKKLSQISAVSSSMRGRFASASGRSDDTPMPALLITASSRPKRATADGDRLAARRFGRPDPPRADECGPMRRRAARVPAASRSTAATVCPRRSAPRVIAAPMPPAAPVTSTTRLLLRHALSVRLDAGRLDDRTPAVHLGFEDAPQARPASSRRPSRRAARSAASPADG